MFNSGTSAAANDIWTMQVSDSTTAEPYLAAEGNRVWVSVAPQGDLAAYESNESGSVEVYVRSFPVARQPTSVSTGGGMRPQWSPDGNTLYYWKAAAGQPDTLFAATVQREPTFAVLAKQPVLAGDYLAPHWDLHPDGDRFIVTRLVLGGQTTGGDAEAAEPVRHLIVTNWFTELLAAVGEGN